MNYNTLKDSKVIIGFISSMIIGIASIIIAFTGDNVWVWGILMFVAYAIMNATASRVRSLNNNDNKRSK
ncbi:MAG: hypothetical protein ACOWWR_04470 [Eubacteriales bacterium]